MRRSILLAGLAILALLPGTGTAADNPPRAIATVGMIADVARNVAGDCVQVDALMGPGVDPHLYEAKSSDVRKLRAADAILYAGYSLEGQLGNVLERLGADKPAVAVSPASIDTGELISVQDLYGIDPHVWMDVSLWSKIAPTIADTLAGIVPDCAAAMERRAAAYREQLAALHQWVADSIATIPEQQRVLVTAHDAFGYYGRAYGIDVKGVQGISTDSEAGIRDIQRMVELTIERDVPAVFIESTINPRTVQAVIDGAAAKGHEVTIGGELYSDAMGNEGTADGTYIGMLRANTMAIVDALGGTTAPWPAALADWAERWEQNEDA
ncbi:metal ABC transporter solute-binding protein, Zn/Mn family [Halofilum ochraceum]|uniref:metal ABC transporter solute-binding protein, Zn/Mn family n=1 Tax=Halofilum ochraceum TaxID=1611323 RepID=UPI0008D8E854|nr:zinc ABC transporter substrate-binding protein [Halofilum ochraceum]